MFNNPEIDTSGSAKIIIHVVKAPQEFAPVMELEFPKEEDLTPEMMIAMRNCLDQCSNKITKLIDAL